ncbi:MAG TPA: MarR family transcriptional regulator [Kineosporiaceae bacterium]
MSHPAGVPPAEHCDELVTELTRHARLLHVFKVRHAGRIPGLDGAAFGVLALLVRRGPQRQGELAEAAVLDPSTVSRYVAQLVRSGLVTRRPHPADGRAVHLVATPEGIALADAALAQRQKVLAELLAGWSADDTATLVRLLRRLNDGMEAQRDGTEHAGRPVGS